MVELMNYRHHEKNKDKINEKGVLVNIPQNNYLVNLLFINFILKIFLQVPLQKSISFKNKELLETFFYGSGTLFTSHKMGCEVNNVPIPQKKFLSNSGYEMLLCAQ